MVAVLTLNICRNLWSSVISFREWNMSLVSIFWVIWRKRCRLAEHLILVVRLKHELHVSFKGQSGFSRQLQVLMLVGLGSRSSFFFLIMFLTYSFDIRHASITWLNVIAVKEFIEFMMAREMFINQSYK